MPFTEQDYENAIIELMKDKLGYDYFYGPAIDRDYHSPLYMSMLRSLLVEINPELTLEAIEEAIFKLQNFDSVHLQQKNKTFMDYLQNGIEVSTQFNGEPRYDRVQLIDYDNPDLNSFAVINQWTVKEHETKRADIVVFINGLPLVVVELKSCSRENTDASDAYLQLRNYMLDIPSLFTYNAFCIMSDLIVSKAGTITAKEDRYMEWKTTDGNYEETKYAAFNILFEGMLEKRRILDIIKNFIVFSDDIKILAGYHQYYAVKKAVERSVTATSSDGKGGIFWHTQGSGKSLSMVFYTQLLQKALQSPTVVVLTDRNDLDDQLYGQFSKCADYLRQTPEQAENRADLKKLLAGRVANGIIFTTMREIRGIGRNPFRTAQYHCDSRRSSSHDQYTLDEKIDPKTGKVTLGFARLVRAVYPMPPSLVLPEPRSRRRTAPVSRCSVIILTFMI